ncbi:hypothetical protein A0J61_05165 [Choanephora cucurbitarum]|uniref:N-acetyltransferase domain-containing protein n=1 Tax=Choanephora cucurbitarum TaxID=101091 RepID=A0A1C7NCU2_9FUNG|nr:hypothetical protein A0J61_05165 [Choanephora cucurbitarum]
MTLSSPEFYARRVTINDLTYAKQATNMFNEANKLVCGGWTSVAHTVKAYGTTVQATEKYIKKSVAGEAIMLLAIKRDAEGNDEAIVGALTIEDAALSIDPKPYSFSGNNNEAMLGQFAINPKYQSKGLGRLLMDTAIEAMREKAYKKCPILVSENRDILLNWYKKLGFSDTNVPIPWTMPDQLEMVQDVKFKLLIKDL